MFQVGGEKRASMSAVWSSRIRGRELANKSGLYLETTGGTEG